MHSIPGAVQPLLRSAVDAIQGTAAGRFARPALAGGTGGSPQHSVGCPMPQSPVGDVGAAGNTKTRGGNGMWVY